MSWAVGWDSNWNRDVGYGVPAKCDYPGCDREINRGLAHVCCNEQIFGGEDGCGLYFCADHNSFEGCARCAAGEDPFEPTPDTQEWIDHKMTHPSWASLRAEQDSCC